MMKTDFSVFDEADTTTAMTSPDYCNTTTGCKYEIVQLVSHIIIHLMFGGFLQGKVYTRNLFQRNVSSIFLKTTLTCHRRPKISFPDIFYTGIIKYNYTELDRRVAFCHCHVAHPWMHQMQAAMMKLL